MSIENPRSTEAGFKRQKGNGAKSARIDFAAINSAAMYALPAILVRLIPGGKVSSGEYVVRNPKRADKNAGLFSVNMRRGRWADFATGDRGGDVISLVAYLEGVSQGEAARLLAKMLGLDTEARP